MPDADRLAVLIDSDNTTASLTTELLEEIAKFGTPTVKRAYGDWTTPQLVGWKEELLRHAIQPMQQFAYTRGKNSTDSALIIDAMDLLYAGNVEGFVIVSSDSDFTRLATRLREAGMTVYGLGRRNTPTAFVAACDRFIYLDLLGDEHQEPARSRRRCGPTSSGSCRRRSAARPRTTAGPASARSARSWSRTTRPSTRATTATASSASSSARSRTSKVKDERGPSGLNTVWVRLNGARAR